MTDTDQERDEAAHDARASAAESHTPGRWVVDDATAGEHYHRIYAERSPGYALLVAHVTRSRVEHHRNALLIASAPDLLASLEALTVACETYLDERAQREIEDALANARQATARAKGARS